MRGRADLLVHYITVEEENRRLKAEYYHAVTGNTTRFLSKRIRMTVKDTADIDGPCGGPAGRLMRHSFRAYQIGRGARANAALPALPEPADLSAKLEEAEAVPAVGAPPALQGQNSNLPTGQFHAEMTREQVSSWMLQHGFDCLIGTFSQYSGTDMLRLTRQDLVTLCGAPNGVRLYYALISKPAIRLTLYMNMPGKTWYHPVYLSTGTVAELADKLAGLLGVEGLASQAGQLPLTHMYLLGPNCIHVLITDELISNLPNEASFSLQLRKDEGTNRCCVLLRTTSPPAQ